MPPAETSRQLKGLPTCGGSNNGGSGGVPSEPENLPCPRCESTNTKFCYYNNYNLSQPRYFCKSCRRYWTRGGSLRNIPVGGGTRKKHSSSSSSSSSSSCKRARNKNFVTTEQPTHEQQYRKVEEEDKKAAAAGVVTTSTTIPCGELVPQQHSTVTTSTATRMYGNMAAVPFPLEIKAERSEMNLNERASNTTTSAAVTMAPVSFTSLLGGGGMFHPQHQEGIGGFGGFLGLSGWGSGLNGSASSGLGFDGLGFGIGGPVGKEEWGDVLGVGGGGEIECKGEEINNEAVCDGGGGGGGRSSGGSSSGCNTWQFGGGGGGLNGEDCFVWSDLAMSTPGTGLE